MSTKQVQQNKREILIHDFEKGLDHTLKAIERELSERNIDLIKRYDKEMVRHSLARGTRLKHLLIILSLSRILKKDWDMAIHYINKWMKDNHKDNRYLLCGDLLAMSESKKNRINKILKEK